MAEINDGFWFPMYPAVWLLDEFVQGLTATEEYAYFRLVMYHYHYGSIPSNPAILAGLCKMGRDEFRQTWEIVGTKFAPSVDDPARLVNDKCLRVLVEQCERMRGKSERGRVAGLKSAERRAEQRSKSEQVLNASSTDVQQTLTGVELALSGRITSVEPPFNGTPTSVDKERKKEREKESTEPGAADLFDTFWERYPKKEKRDMACQMWLSRVNTVERANEFLAGLEKYRRSESWAKDGGKWVPLPSNFLAGEPWKDDPVASAESRRAEKSTEVSDGRNPNGWLIPKGKKIA